MFITTHPASSPEDNKEQEEEAITTPAAPKTFKASFKVVGIDQPGLVYEVTELFYRRGCRVEHINTETQMAPFGGTELFIMDGQIVNDHPVDMDELRDAALKLELEMGLNFEIAQVEEQQQTAIITTTHDEEGLYEPALPILLIQAAARRQSSYC